MVTYKEGHDNSSSANNAANHHHHQYAHEEAAAAPPMTSLVPRTTSFVRRKQTPSLSAYQTTPIEKHYELNHQILLAFESNYEQKIYSIAYLCGLQFVETALLEIPKHGYFYSNRHAEQRMQSSLEAVRVCQILQELQARPDVYQLSPDMVQYDEQVRVSKLANLAMAQVNQEQDLYEEQRSKAEVELRHGSHQHHNHHDQQQQQQHSNYPPLSSSQQNHHRSTPSSSSWISCTTNEPMLATCSDFFCSPGGSQQQQQHYRPSSAYSSYYPPKDTYPNNQQQQQQKGGDDNNILSAVTTGRRRGKKTSSSTNSIGTTSTTTAASSATTSSNSRNDQKASLLLDDHHYDEHYKHFMADASTSSAAQQQEPSHGHQQQQQRNPRQDSWSVSAAPPPLLSRGMQKDSAAVGVAVPKEAASAASKNSSSSSKSNKHVTHNQRQQLLLPPPQRQHSFVPPPPTSALQRASTTQSLLSSTTDEILLGRALFLSGLEVMAAPPPPTEPSASVAASSSVSQQQQYQQQSYYNNFQQQQDPFYYISSTFDSLSSETPPPPPPDSRGGSNSAASAREPSGFQSFLHHDDHPFDGGDSNATAARTSPGASMMMMPTRHAQFQQASSVLQLNMLSQCYHEDFDHLVNTKRIRITFADTYQGRSPESTNGCTVIAPLLCIHHLLDDQIPDYGLPDETIMHVIDVETPVILTQLRQELGLSAQAFLIPSDAHDYLIDNGQLSQRNFLNVTGGNILDEGHLAAFVNAIAEKEYHDDVVTATNTKTDRRKRIAATFFFHEHVVAILKLRQDRNDKTAWYDLIDGLPLKETLQRVGETSSNNDWCNVSLSSNSHHGGAGGGGGGSCGDVGSVHSSLSNEAFLPRTARIRCLTAEALTACLRWYACSKFSEDNITYIDQYPWNDNSCDFDPRVFQGFVWGSND